MTSKLSNSYSMWEKQDDFKQTWLLGDRCLSNDRESFGAKLSQPGNTMFQNNCIIERNIFVLWQFKRREYKAYYC